MSESVVLVTGGLTGIGRAVAFAFARKGATVVIAGRHVDAGGTLVRELEDLGATADFVQMDVRNEEDIRRAVDDVVARFGRIDVAINNAGIEAWVGPIVDLSSEDYTKAYDVNVRGVLLSMKYEVRVMQAQGKGSIVNISSLYGHGAVPFNAIYVSAKHAVEGMTKSIALELAKSGIRVNAVAPGPTDTGMLTRFTGTDENKAALVSQVPMARMGRPEEVADGVVFLASDEARFITGHVLNVDGGGSAS